MSSKSNQHGRALEFALVEELEKRLPEQVVVTLRAAESQLRDLAHYQGLTPEMQHKFAKFSFNCLIVAGSKLSSSEWIVFEGAVSPPSLKR
jgi:hypothetical protein